MNVYTQPSEDNCPDCIELVDANCVVYEQSFTSTGLGAGKTLAQILKSINNKLLKFSSWFKKLIYNFTPVFESGIPIATYTDGSCTTPTVNLNIPLFLNGKYCFEFPVDEETTGYFSVLSVMGNYVFYDEEGTEVTDPESIAAYEELFAEELVVPTCCTDCGTEPEPESLEPLLYRALVSQLAPIPSRTSGTSAIGQLWTITTYAAGDDFSNWELVSGSANTTGAVYRATTAFPTVWTNGSDLAYDGSLFITGLNTSNNIGHFKNDFTGNPTFTYTSAGDVNINLTGAFIVGKTSVTLSLPPKSKTAYYEVDNTINFINLKIFSRATGIQTNGLVTNQLLTIEVQR